MFNRITLLLLYGMIIASTFDRALLATPGSYHSATVHSASSTPVIYLNTSVSTNQCQSSGSGFECFGPAGSYNYSFLISNGLVYKLSMEYVMNSCEIPSMGDRSMNRTSIGRGSHRKRSRRCLGNCH